ncbi:alpha-amylase [Mucilaginibacter daejeonensis]|uniref:alpha-amylase family glycosyl hydrolase n=1 Tax=Mucilaginibacter daejeonensis TaxID=398049 RepID=UPI001D1760A5|nr:alpha-amylase family glycosyl hydrolase [Mucilaginibacter daejeonensis]UEG53988.1 alpha-amylase [Mucilaginibacter daejeonensis]
MRPILLNTWLIAMLAFTLLSCKKGNDVNTTEDPPSTSEVPNNAGDGVTFTNSGRSAIFNLYAPEKTSVSVIGEFNNWTPTAMKKTADGSRWWIQVDNLDPAKEYAYQYLVDNTIRIADPYTEKVLDPDNDRFIPASTYPDLKAYPTGSTTGLVSVIQATQPSYTWKVNSFSRPEPKNLVVYELLVRDFVDAHNYQTLTDTLNYLKNLGINAIELLPVNEFEGNDSWGYNTNFCFALDKYYGTKNSYKAFIDACHAKGMAVIQDIVLEDQFGSSPMVRLYANSKGEPAANNPWFNTQNLHPYAVGYQMNHGSAAVQRYTKDVLKYWMQEYHIDGYRLDQSKAFTQTVSSTDAAWSAYDAARVATLKMYNTYLKSIDPTCYLILEHFAVNAEEAELANSGMIMWSNMNYNANQATMGYNTDWDLSGLFYDRYGFTQPYNRLAYFESHDEERLMFKNEQYGNSYNGYNVKDLATGLARQEMAAAFLLSPPGPKLIWQFGERGYDVSIDNNGRLGTKPPRWEYMNVRERRQLYNTYARLVKMKINNPVFTTTNFKYDLGGNIKTIQLTGTDGMNVLVAGNFDVAPQQTNVTLPVAGTWYDYLSGTTINAPTVNYTLNLKSGEYHVYSSAPLK